LSVYNRIEKMMMHHSK